MDGWLKNIDAWMHGCGDADGMRGYLVPGTTTRTDCNMYKSWSSLWCLAPGGGGGINLPTFVHPY